jgi:ferritin
MSMSESLEQAMNEQIRLEFASMYVYLQMAAHLDSENLAGFAHWMRLQAEEERSHAMKIFDYVLDRGNEVALRPLDAPKVDTSSPLAVFEQALAHEREVTGAIHALYRQATDESDYASFPLLQWFVEEQIEEESTVSTIVDRLRMAGGDATAVLLLDQELGSRS